MDFDNSTSRAPQSRVVGSDPYEHQRTKRVILLDFVLPFRSHFTVFSLRDRWFLLAVFLLAVTQPATQNKPPLTIFISSLYENP
jgi:hypothetical protein